MIDKINILEIRFDALKILKKDSSLSSYYVVYYIFPIIASCILVFLLSVRINTELFKNLIAGISLFSGLLFSIIFIVSNNYKERKISYNSKDEENVRYLKTYYEFSSNLISLISYSIVKALTIIVLTVIISIYSEFIDPQIDLALKTMWVLLLVLLYQFLVYILIILKEIYTMQYEEINRNNGNSR